MLRKIVEAVNLLVSNFILFSKITLTVWLPGSIIIALLHYYVLPSMAAEDELRAVAMEFRISNLIELAFSPWYAGALIYALSKIKLDETANYRESMGYAATRSLKLFATRLSTGLIIFLGLIALIVPGIILGLRYALVDPIVVLEEINGGNARQRSVELTKGNRLKIFSTTILAWVGLIIFSLVLSWVLYTPLILLGQESNILLDIVYDCILSVVSIIFYILLFLFYWEGKARTSDRVEFRSKR